MQTNSLKAAYSSVAEPQKHYAPLLQVVRHPGLLCSQFWLKHQLIGHRIILFHLE